MGAVTELKFRVPGPRLRTLASGKIPGVRGGKRAQRDLVSTYFDTTGHKLQRQGLTLRVRRSGDEHLQTIKGPATGINRGEWETPVAGSAPDLTKFEGTPLEKFASRKLGRKLKPVFTTAISQTTVMVATEDSEIELAIDRGRIVAGRRQSPIAELELKRGVPRALFRLGRILAAHAAAELYLPTKSERGYALARGEVADATVAGPIVLDDEMVAREAFRSIAHACFAHFVRNADAVRRGEAEGIHQMRVGLRRMRAAISLFSGFLPGAETERIKGECKWLTDELAAAREIDVFVARLGSAASRRLAPRRGRKAIEREFVLRRARAVRQIVRMLASDRFRALLVDLLAWIEEDRDGDKDRAIGKAAARILRQRVKKARRQGRELGELSTRERHRYRIRIKKLRYAVEFFEGLFPGKRTQRSLARLSKRLKRIQDALGSLNDMAVHRDLATQAALGAGQVHRRARPVASGVIVGDENRAAARLLRAAMDDARKLRRPKLV